MEEGRVAEGVRRLHVGEVASLSLGEADGEHGLRPLHVVRHALGGQGRGDQRGQPVGVRVQGPVDRVVRELQGRQAGGHGHRVTRQGAGLVDGADRGEHVHDVGASTEGCRGHTAGDDLAEGGEVAGHAVDPEPALARGTEAGHHLVDDEQSTIGVGDLLERGVEAVVGVDRAHVAGGGLDDDRGDLAGVLGEGLPHGVQVVVGHGDGLRRGGRGDAGRVGQAQRGDTGTGGDQQGVDVAVVAADELEDPVTAGEAAGQAHRGHGGLGAGIHHADLLHAGTADDLLGQGDLPHRRRAEGDALGHGRLHGVHHHGVGVAVDHRTPGTDQVDVVVAVDVDQPGAVGGGDERRGTADGAEGADRGVHAAGDHPAGLLHRGRAGGQVGLGVFTHHADQLNRRAVSGSARAAGSPPPRSAACRVADASSPRRCCGSCSRGG